MIYEMGFEKKENFDLNGIVNLKSILYQKSAMNIWFTFFMLYRQLNDNKKITLYVTVIFKHLKKMGFYFATAESEHFELQTPENWARWLNNWADYTAIELDFRP